MPSALVCSPPRAYAYPQFELSHDQTCTGCHISPTGGGLLSENGLTSPSRCRSSGPRRSSCTASVTTPDWLDARRRLPRRDRLRPDAAALPARHPDAGRPLRRRDVSGTSRLHVTLGYRPAEYDNENATHVWSREHYVMWQSGARRARRPVRPRRPVHAGVRAAARRAPGVHAAVRRHAALRRHLRRRGRVHHEKIDAHVTGFIKRSV